MSFFRLAGGIIINIDQIVMMTFKSTGEAMVFLSNGNSVTMTEEEVNRLMPLVDAYLYKGDM